MEFLVLPGTPGPGTGIDLCTTVLAIEQLSLGEWVDVVQISLQARPKVLIRRL